MKIHNKLYIVAAFLLVALVACDTEELVEMNKNPNASNEIDWRFNLTNAQLLACENRYVNWRANIIYAGHLIQHLGGWGYTAGYTYTDFPSHSASYFDYVYENALKEAAEVIRQTGPDGTDPDMVNTHNVARITYIIAMHRMTDLYGNVPYFDANQGIEGKFNPPYDHQQEIYTKEGIDEEGVRGGMLWELKDAAEKLGNGDDQLGNHDLIYGGDLDKWKKLAYSLMLRLSMRIYEADPETAEEYINIAINGGVMESNEDNAWVPMAGGPSMWVNQNGYSRAMHPDDGGHGSVLGKPLVDLLKGNDPDDTSDDDPRLMMISGGIGEWGEMQEGTAETDPLEQEGMPAGLNAERLQDYLGVSEDSAVDYQITFSRINPKLLDLDEPYMLMGYSEVELLLAEAAQRDIGNVSGDAESHFKAGVRADINRYELHDESFAVSEAEVNDFINNHLGPPTLENIGAQYWLTTFMNHYEAWANWRRTGYPSSVAPPDEPLPNNVTNNEIMLRLEYPSSEPAVNPNYSDGATQPNDYMTPVWWDTE